MRVLVIGSGVIGQVYGGRLEAAGHEVTMLARGGRARVLAESGIRLVSSGKERAHRVAVTTTLADGADVDVALLAVRYDQLGPAVEVAQQSDARQIATLCNLPSGIDQLQDRLGGRLLPAFPGLGGEIDASGAVHFTQVPQQPTTVGRAGGDEADFVAALRAAALPVAVVDDMPAWLTTHAVFLTGVAAALVLHDGDATALGRDRTATARMVRAVREGFTALRRAGTTPTPRPLRTIFGSVPRLVSVPYWQRQLRGPVGTETIAPHVRATRETELPALAAQVRRLTAPHAPTLASLLDEAGL